MHEGDRHAALADGGSDTLHGARADVTTGEDTWDAGLEEIRVTVESPGSGGGHVGAGEHVAVAIEGDLGRQPVGLRP
jgi:hypothetical protein